MISFPCTSCGKKLRVPQEYAGRTVLCPYCKSQVSAPATELQPVVQPLRSEREPARRRPIEEFDDTPMSRPTEKIDPEELIDMTAMVDIVFFLLIFFLVTSMAGINSSMPLPNPESQQKQGGAGPKTVDETNDDSDFIVVRISKDDVVEVEGVTLKDISELPFRLRQLRNSGGGATGLLVIGHGSATHGTAVACLDAGYDAEFDKVRLAVTDEQAE